MLAQLIQQNQWGMHTGLQIGAVGCKAAQWWRANVRFIHGHWRPARHSYAQKLPFRLHQTSSTLGIVVLHVAVACAVPFQRAQWHATLRATRARNAPANVTIGFRFVGLCGTMFTPVLEYVIAALCLQIPSRWGAFWWRMGWSNLMMISYIAQRLIPASIC